MDKESNHNKVKPLFSVNVLRDTSTNAFGCLLTLVILSAVLAGILFAKSKVDSKPLSDSLEITMYVAAAVTLIFLVATIRLRIRSNFDITIGESTDGKKVITVNDPKEPKTIEGPFQIDYFYYKDIVHGKPLIKMNQLRLAIKKEDTCCLILHEVYGGFKSPPEGWDKIEFNQQFERYGKEAYRNVDYVVAAGDEKVCEKFIALLTSENQ